ncbi:MAG: bifunctional glutamate N-acetyltransferase/amino-acid acetyltransferase ArgJ [Clostridiales bacterium]|nr:bifunctional glutamate N-acetyltransferase/amino-acid acetyltransferase ArgJ [Clostridiales bacterium]
MIKEIQGGVCAPKGFKASGVHCGIRKNKAKKDFALIVSEVNASAAGVFTQNLVKGAPVILCKEHLKSGYAQAIVCNSGNANTCNKNGIEIAEKMCQMVERVSKIKANDVLVASTGVIGQPLNIAPMEEHIDQLYSLLGDDSKSAAEAIMTTDTIAKSVAVKFTLGGRECKIGAIAKGVGMVCPNMATNLIFITSDVAISPKMLQKALSNDVKSSFNMVSVDGDQSTNDTCVILCNGLAQNKIIEEVNADYKAFAKALNYCTVKLSKMIAKDGEGATKLIECNVFGAKSVKMARGVAKTVIKSSLFKAAMFGADANWGRVLCAIGYSGEEVEVERVDVSFKSKAGVLEVCKDGYGIEFSEEHAKKVLSEDEVQVNINLKIGKCKASAWGCDLTYDYVKINGDYRT